MTAPDSVSPLVRSDTKHGLAIWSDQTHHEELLAGILLVDSETARISRHRVQLCDSAKVGIDMNDRQLALIKEFTSLCKAASIEYWLRGGWAMDFFLGRITREHEDIDLFVWARDASTLAHELERAGFREQGGPPPKAQRDFTKDGEELQIALLDTNQLGEVVAAGGPWAGSPWPEGMLTSPGGRLGDVVCPIINPRLQIEIKEKFQEWRSDPPRSDKHHSDITRLREALALLNE